VAENGTPVSVAYNNGAGYTTIGTFEANDGNNYYSYDADGLTTTFENEGDFDKPRVRMVVESDIGGYNGDTRFENSCLDSFLSTETGTQSVGCPDAKQSVEFYAGDLTSGVNDLAD